ncbi:MAG: methionyl-tRNA formyltransferase [Bacteroidales bacterium]|nr:methionyl-tRNA formyltransferase [Bacteroidales bacterium]
MSEPIHILFMGTPAFAVPSLSTLIENGYRIAGVVTAPDKPAGRGQQVRMPDVKRFALQAGLPVMQPLNLRDREFLDLLHSMNIDLAVVVAFRMLPAELWSLPRMGAMNLHASLLPQYRGAAPINWAIINGENKSGLTTFMIDHQIDTGKILMQEEITISENETAGTLHDKMMKQGAKLVLKTIRGMLSGNITTLDQSLLEKQGFILKSAPRITREDCVIIWTHTVASICRLVRGLSPHPCAFTEMTAPSGQKYSLRAFFARPAEIYPPSPAPCGQVLWNPHKDSIFVQAADGVVALTEVQLAGKKKMPAGEFLKGFPLDNHWKMGQPEITTK